MSRLVRRLNNNSGIILIIVLWVLIILTALAIGLGRSTSIELALARNNIGKVKSRYLAWAGINYARALIQADTSNEETRDGDSLYFCGRAKSEESIEDLFKEVSLNEGYFNLEYQGSDAQFRQTSVFGFIDEESKLNLNAINVQTVTTLSELIKLFGFNEDSALTVAYSVVDWIDHNKSLSDDQYGAEEDYYAGLSVAYKPKNRVFDSKEELMLVRGVSQDIYKAIKNYISVLPETQLSINFDTAPAVTLKAFARSQAKSAQVDIEAADSMVEKMLAYRAGDDGVEMTEDDQLIDHTQISFNQSETALFLNMSNSRVKVAKYFNIRVQGVDEQKDISTTIEAVVKRADLSLLSFRRY